VSTAVNTGVNPEEPGQVSASADVHFELKALPLLVDNEGGVKKVGTAYVFGQPIFSSDQQAFLYLLDLAKRDLQYRGTRDERLSTFEYKQHANFLLYRNCARCTSDAEYEYLRQSWDLVNRPKYSDLAFSTEQTEALRLIADGISHEDEETRRQSKRFLYVSGPPGSGKSAVILEAALRAATSIHVDIVRPTGKLVHQYKSKLPDMDGYGWYREHSRGYHSRSP